MASNPYEAYTLDTALAFRLQCLSVSPSTALWELECRHTWRRWWQHPHHSHPPLFAAVEYVREPEEWQVQILAGAWYVCSSVLKGQTVHASTPRGRHADATKMLAPSVFRAALRHGPGFQGLPWSGFAPRPLQPAMAEPPPAFGLGAIDSRMHDACLAAGSAGISMQRASSHQSGTSLNCATRATGECCTSKCEQASHAVTSLWQAWPCFSPPVL